MVTTDDQQALLLLCESLRPRLQEFDGRALVTMLHRLAKLSKALKLAGVPSDDFGHDWCRAAGRQLPSMHAQELANAIWALATLGWSHIAQREGFITAWASASEVRIHTPPPPPSVSMSCRLTTAQAHLDSFTAQGLGTVIFALGMLGLGSSGVGVSWFGSWAQGCITQLAHFDDISVVNTLWALSLLDLGEARLGRAFFATWSGRCLQALPALPAKRLVLLARGIANLRVGTLMADGYYARWAAALQPALSTLDGAQLIELVDALGTLTADVGSAVVTPHFYATWQRACCAKMATLNPNELATV